MLCVVLCVAWDLAAEACLAQVEAHHTLGTAFKPSTFFEEQLTGFEVWLEFGNEQKPPPVQLPVLLQVPFLGAAQLLLCTFADTLRHSSICLVVGCIYVM